LVLVLVLVVGLKIRCFTGDLEHVLPKRGTLVVGDKVCKLCIDLHPHAHGMEKVFVPVFRAVVVLTDSPHIFEGYHELPDDLLFIHNRCDLK
jgi:hypothetical protein